MKKIEEVMVPPLVPMSWIYSDEQCRKKMLICIESLAKIIHAVAHVGAVLCNADNLFAVSLVERLEGQRIRTL